MLKNLTVSDPIPSPIINGSKIIAINFDDIRIIDSYFFILIRLADFQKTFFLSELKKGYFPHLFYTPENVNYIEKLH